MLRLLVREALPFNAMSSTDNSHAPLHMLNLEFMLTRLRGGGEEHPG